MAGIAFLAFFLCGANIVLWLIFLLKFKKLFSVDDIITSTRTEVNRMIEDLNRNTARDIDLLEGKIEELNIVMAKAEKRIAVAKSELEKQANSEIYRRLINEKSSSNSQNTEKDGTKPLHKTREQKAAQSYKRTSDGLKSNLSFDITENGTKLVEETAANSRKKTEEAFLDFGDTENSRTLSESASENKEKDNLNFVKSSSGTKFSVDSEGISVASIPKIGPNVTFAENAIDVKKNLNDSLNGRMKELYEAGFSVEDIATELGVTTTEVQFFLDMNT